MTSFVALLGLAFAAVAQDPVRVAASLSASSVGVGETVVLDVSVETNGPAPERLEPPPLPSGLEVVGTRDYSQLQFSLPGGRTRTVRREFVIRARAAGQYTIPPAIVRVQGRDYSTRPQRLLVSDARGGGGAGGGPPASGAREAAPSAGPDDEVILIARVLPDTVYVGQQITFQAEAMLSHDVRLHLRRAPEYVPPNPVGFWVQDLHGAPMVEPRVIHNRLYEVQTFRRAYFPLSPGLATFPPARLVYEIRRGFLFAPESRELNSDSLRVVVLPLPEAGRPSDFNGAVGQFTVTARIEPAEVPAGEAAMLHVEVSGPSNIKAAPPPELPDWPGMRVYPPSEEADVVPIGGVVQGTKRFTWVIVPEEDGRHELAPIRYPYFDPVRGEYDVAWSTPLALRVTPAPGAVTRDGRPATVRYLKDRPGREAPLAWVRSPVFLAVQALPLLAFVGLLLARRIGGRERSPSARSLRARRRQAIAALRTRANGQDPEFFAELAALLRDWLADRLGEPRLRRPGVDGIRRAFEDRGIPTAIGRAAAELLARLDRARYEPVRPDARARNAMLDDAERLLDAIDRHVRRRAPAATMMLLAIAILSASPAAGFAQAPQADRFSAGYDAFLNGDMGGAREHFAAHVEAHPFDAHGWYNLGNAYFHAGDRARAAWAWLRAARLAPRDRDTRHNLRAAGIPSEVVDQATPTLPISPDESLLLASLAWLVGAAGLGRYLWTRRRPAGIMGVAAIGLAILCLGGWAVNHRRPPLAIVLDAETPVHAAPNLHSEQIFDLPAPAAVQVRDSASGGAWLRILARDGGEGWIEAMHVGRL